MRQNRFKRRRFRKKPPGNTLYKRIIDKSDQSKESGQNTEEDEAAKSRLEEARKRKREG